MALLSTTSDLQVVGEASDGAQAVDLADALTPDVILLDLEMPDAGGVETIRRIRESRSDARIIVFTAYDTDDLVIDAVRAGVEGFLLKGTPRDELFDAIRTVHGGGSLLQPAITAELMARVGRKDGAAGADITDREREVLQVLAKGLTNREIADALHISERTAKFHVSALLRKLEAENRTEAVSRAIQLRLVEL